jgi:hypothetical protein
MIHSACIDAYTTFMKCSWVNRDKKFGQQLFCVSSPCTGKSKERNSAPEQMKYVYGWGDTMEGL